MTRRHPPEWVSAKPKRFAWTLGLAMSLAMTVITNSGVRGLLPRTICLICLALMWLESVLGLCVGCEIHGLLVRRGWRGRTRLRDLRANPPVRGPRPPREAPPSSPARARDPYGVAANSRHVAGHARQLVLAPLLEIDARAGHDVLDRARDEHLARPGGRGDPRTDVDGRAAHDGPRLLDLAGVHARAQLDAQLTAGRHDGRGAADRAGRPPPAASRASTDGSTMRR